MTAWLSAASVVLGVTGWFVLSVAAGVYLGMALLHRHYLRQAERIMAAHESAAVAQEDAP